MRTLTEEQLVKLSAAAQQVYAVFAECLAPFAAGGAGGQELRIDFGLHEDESVVPDVPSDFSYATLTLQSSDSLLGLHVVSGGAPSTIDFWLLHAGDAVGQVCLSLPLSNPPDQAVIASGRAFLTDWLDGRVEVIVGYTGQRAASYSLVRSGKEVWRYSRWFAPLWGTRRTQVLRCRGRAAEVGHPHG